MDSLNFTEEVNMGDSLAENMTRDISSEPLYDYCGSRFWDPNLSWNTDNPDFTDCFQKTVLVWVPCLWLWVFSLLEFYFIQTSKGRFIPWTMMNIVKTVINVLLIIVCIADLVWAVNAQNGGSIIFPVDIYTPAIKLATLVLALVLLLAGKRCGIRSSAVIFVFWLLLALCGAVTYRSQIMRASDPVEAVVQFTFVTYMIYYPLVVLMLFLNCFSDAPPEYEASDLKAENPSPELGASFVSKLTFAWFDKLAILGYRRSLEMKDLWKLKPEDRSVAVVPKWDKYWNRAVTKAKEKSAKADGKVEFSKTKGNVELKTEPQKKKVSILPTMVKTFGWSFLWGSLLKLVQDVLTFISPQLLSALIDFVESDQYTWRGYLYAGLMTAAAFIQTIFLGQYFQQMYVVGMRIRTAIVSAVYRKALRVSSSGRKATVGEIVNLMAVDAQRFMDLTSYLNMLWSAPLQISLAIYFLYNILGPSVFAGLGVMVLLIPVNGVLAGKTRNLQVAQMKNKDKRVKMMNEILSGIKVLKLYAWEPSFQDQVEEIRTKEIDVLKKAAYLSAGTSFLWTCAPFLVSLVTFAVYVLSDVNNVLDAQKAFVSLSLFNIIRMPMSILPVMIIAVVQVALVTFATYVLVDPTHVLSPKIAFSALALFNILRFPMSMLPMIISQAVQASVSLKRMNEFLNADELDPDAVSHDPDEKNPIVIENGTFAWDEEKGPILKDINIEVEEGGLIAVVGQVGAGKSSLISAVLGEMNKINGRVNTKGSIAYVPQQAWIQNTTLKNNIVFGGSEDDRYYNQVIDACALRPDLDILPGGDSTEIGEKGINLSGGQKQRVSLARAVYNNADVYLFDDPLSAVDTHVGKHIFDSVIGPSGLLHKKTRVLVTHGITFLPQTDKIIVMKDGVVSESGSYKELLQKKGDFAEFLLEHLTEEQEQEDGLTELTKIREELESSLGREEIIKRQLSRQRSHLSESQSHLSDSSVTSSPQHSAKEASVEKSGNLPRGSVDKTKSPTKEVQANGTAPEAKKGEKLIEAEKAETGKVKPEVYLHYLRSIGLNLTFWTLFLYAVYQIFSVGSNVWLSSWSNAYVPPGNSTEPVPIPASERDMFLGVYGALGFGQALFGLCEVVPYHAAALASAKLHHFLISRMLRSPQSFFDTVPAGRILSRFSKDLDAVDNLLPRLLIDWVYCLYEVLATIVVISYTTPIFLVIVLPIAIIYYFMQHFYVSSSRQLKRLESITRSPIYSHFGETITGASVIRAYSQQVRFIHESESRVDINQVCYYPSIVANRWLAVRLETVGNLIVLFAALFAVIGRDSLNPGLVGLSISYALNITQTLNWFMRMTSEVETNIVAVERIKEYGETPQEAPWELPEKKPSKDWPEEGKVEFVDYQVRYREGLDLVLKGISCSIQGSEKVGIVGRTGAGKSSLTLGLFRIIEPAGGTIKIDGLDITKMGLHSLRSRLTIIPQDPVLFSGTLRINLDPFKRHSDDELWRALELAHLKTFVQSLSAGLEHEISEGGENLSVGQRQLVCLARALLRKTKVLILDEATAAVDLETDDLIQATIRKEFKDCTVITIAHRLNTIMDSTRVLVLDKGEIKEFDTPAILLADKSSIFYGMAKDANLV